MAVVVSTPNPIHADHGDAATAERSGGERGMPEASSLLEYSQNVVVDDPSGIKQFELAKCGCSCWFCDDCCERMGYNRRAELVSVLETFTGLMMITLTIDPELFDSPREAYLHVRKRRGPSELMRHLWKRGYLHSKRYFCVVEFQKHTEQAHFHMLIDATRVPKTAIDEAWSRLRPKSAGPCESNRPPFGMTRFSKREFSGGALHAARYATKYLVKTPEHGWPSWVMEMGGKKRVPRYSTSHRFWNRPRRVSASTGKKRERTGRSYRERVAECGTASNVFQIRDCIDLVTGEVREVRDWIGRLGLPADLLAMLVPIGRRGRPRVRLRAQELEGCVAMIESCFRCEIPILNSVRRMEVPR